MKVKSESEVAQLCLTLSNPMDCSLTGSSVHGIFQARVLEWGAIAFSDLDEYQHMNGQRRCGVCMCVCVCVVEQYSVIKKKKERSCAICRDVDGYRNCHTK